MARALNVEINDYRGRRGTVFYASPAAACDSPAVTAEVAELGRILGYTPHREALPPPPREVPDQGPDTHDALVPLQARRSAARSPGTPARAKPTVVFAFDGFDQADLDLFAQTFNLPSFTPEVVGGQPPDRRGEATMDLQAVHAVAPDAEFLSTPDLRWTVPAPTRRSPR